MLNQFRLAKQKKLFVILLVLASMTVAGCAGEKLAPDLLANVEVNGAPLVNHPVSISVEINPKINNYEKLDETVKASLELALENANIFSAGSTQPYRISANILIASQSAWSFGAFNGKLEISYAVFDESNSKIIDEKIFTEAGSDRKNFSGAARHRRARAVNISKNVLQFVGILQTRLKTGGTATE